ncbi:hypothetical protein YN1551_1502 [Sulfolobus islandicus Y.N.15.51]|uniref:Uncharacterized protein n=1 Tax=Saccharolobus islandicus (strain Y.N.15.51 / Yellowstone \|nr:hypothetical protein [Sulfolobus islandicus]ACP48591.1 hypothetical protein YN1551_1502 [Sulfolobus islandicus Y.N.15.51]
MGLFKSKQNANKKVNDRSEKGERKKVKYVWVSSRKAIFIIAGEVKESKYSYGIPIIPLHGYYRSKDKSYTARELGNYYVILNLPKDVNIDELEGKRIVVLGYDKGAIYIDENDTSDESNDNDEEGEGGDEEK